MVVKTSLDDENNASNVFSAHLREDQGPGSTEKKRGQQAEQNTKINNEQSISARSKAYQHGETRIDE